MEKVYADASVSPIFGCAYCVIIAKKRPKKIVKVTENVNNAQYLEYVAIFHALEICPEESIVFSDCKGAVNDILFNEKSVHDVATEIFNAIKKLMEEKRCTLKWISRNKNLAGRYLEKRLYKLKTTLNYQFPKRKHKLNYRKI